MTSEDGRKSQEDMVAESVQNLKMSNSKTATSTNMIPEVQVDKFAPYDLTSAPKIQSDLPSEIWTIVQCCPAYFPPQYFLDVSRNLLENPNLTASHLARAELSYSSFTDATFDPKAQTPDELASIIKHLRPECRPRLVEGGIPGYELEWTVVRKLIPRNPKLDDSLMQTCHLYKSTAPITISKDDGTEEVMDAERYLVVYIPHATNPDDIPFYHPKVRSLGILYTYLTSHISTSILTSPGTLSIYFDFFPSHPQDNRLTRTALKLLEIIHKHSKGRQAGYKKRVHHDQIIPQKRFQDTYAYLKGKYAKELIENWVEQTPPEKHVFEDLGIAAFLIELWKDMYSSITNNDNAINNDEEKQKPKFPGFVDIGCGNGLLVYILNAEGWPGWGFDARRRKTWATFGATYSDKLSEMLLIPSILTPSDPFNPPPPPLLHSPPSHPGLFPSGTFIISNHADELTSWTPLLASLSSSPFIAIPCCSHDFGGTRFRSPVHKKYIEQDPNATGREKNKQPSAYAGLCSWVSYLTERMGYVVEKEYLRIPSTRNIAILGRGRVGKGREGADGGDGDGGLEERMGFAREVVEREMGGSTTIEQVGLMWMRSGGELVKPGKGGH